jgi:septum formation protein
VILASQSAARLRLLRGAGLTVQAIPARIDEAAVKSTALQDGQSAASTALILAGLKARRVAGRCPGALVIGADQLLVCEGRWFDKPEDHVAARLQLQSLRGRKHQLVTALVCQRGEQQIWQHVAVPELVMRAFSEEFLVDYLAHEGDAVLSSVGGYRLEGMGAQLFDAIEGDYFAVLGLPLLPLLAFLRQHGVLSA